MAIDRLLQQSAFAADDIRSITFAYEEALNVLRLARRIDPLTEMVAKKIIEAAQTGERDPSQIRRLALRKLGIPSGEIVSFAGRR
jgi:hypothetical protein